MKKLKLTSLQLIFTLLFLLLYLSACAHQDKTPKSPSLFPQLSYINDELPIEQLPRTPQGNSPLAKAFTLWLQGKTIEAIETIEKNNIKDPQASFLLAWLYYERADLNNATTLFIDFLQNNPSHPYAYPAALTLTKIFPDSLRKDLFARINKINFQKTSPQTTLSLFALYNLTRKYHAQEWNNNELPPTYTELNKWKILGPWTTNAITEFNDPLPIDNDPHYKNKYQHNNFNLQTINNTNPFGLTFNPPIKGLYSAETFIKTNKDTKLFLYINTEQLFEITIDQKLIMKRTPIEIQTYTQKARLISLPKGTHQIRIKFSVLGTHIQFPNLILLPQNPKEQFEITELSSAPDNPENHSIEPLNYLRFNAHFPSNPQQLPLDPMLTFLDAYMASHNGDFKSADESLNRTEKAHPNNVPSILLLESRYALDKSLDPTYTTDKRIDALELLTNIAPQITNATLKLATIYRERKLHKNALEILQKNKKTATISEFYLLSEFLSYRALSWDNEAYNTLLAAYTQNNKDCSIVRHYIHERLKRSHLEKLENLSPEAQNCPSVIQFYIDNEIPIESSLLEKISSIQKRYNDNLENTLELSKSLLHNGQIEQSLQNIQQAINKDTFAQTNTDKYIELIDLLFAKNDPQKAYQLLEQLIKKYPADEQLLNTLWHFHKDNLISALRKDALKVIKDYMKNHDKKEEFGSFYILDYSAYKYFEDGSSISITHQIGRVTNKEGINLLGEIYIPEKAIIVNLRTIKNNTYESIEPEIIAHKSSFSMPNLEAGDFVDVEYIIVDKPINTAKPSFIVPMWFFQTTDMPLLHSEFVLEFPSHLKPITFIRGSIPNPTITTTNNQTRYTYLMKNMMTPKAEPLSVHNYDYIPNIQFAYDYNWEILQRSIANNIAFATQITQNIIDTYNNELNIQPNDSDEDKLRKIFAYVQNNITEKGNYFEGFASWTLSSSTGSRIGLLKAFIDLAKIKNTPVLIKWALAPKDLTTIPDLSFFVPYLKVSTKENDQIYLNPSETFTPFDYLPPELQNQYALPLNTEDLTPFITKTYPSTTQASKVELKLNIAEDESVHVTGSESMKAQRAIHFRQLFYEFKNDEAQLKRKLQNMMSYSYGNVKINSFKVDNLNLTDEPLILHHDFTASNFAQIVDNEIIISSHAFSLNLTENLAPLPSRLIALQIPNTIADHRIMTFTVPQNFLFHKNLKNAEIKSKFGTFSRKLIYNGNKLTVDDQFNIPIQKIEANDYEEFKKFVKSIDEAHVFHFTATKNQ